MPAPSPASSTAPTSTAASSRTAAASPTRTAADRAAAVAADRSTPGGERAAQHLAVAGISKQYAGRRVLSDVSFTARPGDRLGLIGENGTGKSTLLRILGGSEHADAGSIVHAGSVGSLLQELPYPDTTPVCIVLDDAQRDALAAREAIERAGEAYARNPDASDAAEAYAAALEDAERSGAWDAESRRGDTVTGLGLGLGGISEDRPVGELSGGQRLRLALAALLLEAPHTMLLDEPSNHLDDASAAYLEQVLVAWPGIVIVASHDRALLDAVTTRIIDLDAAPVPAEVLADAESSVGPGGAEAPGAETTDDTGSGLRVRVWGTGYSAAREAQRAELVRWRERYAAECTERSALVHEIEVGSREVNKKHESRSEARITRKFYADKDARVTSRRARNARVRLEQLERERVRRPPEPLRFAGFATAVDEAGDGSGATALRVIEGTDDVVLRAERIGLTGRLAPTSFALETGGRLMLTGPNGAGKSTLLAILAGELAADSGRVERAPRLRIGYLPQEVAFARPELSAERSYAAAVGSSLAAARPLVESGLLAPRDVSRPVGALSVGQRRRLALASLVADPPEILLLDEPTNHLSLTLVEELEEALREFSGALVIATHDRWLRSRWEGEVLAL